MYTTLLSFKPETDRGLKVIALPELQEVGDYPCDTGSDVEVLRKELTDQPVDLSYIPDDWNSKKGDWGSTDDLVNKRVSKVRQWLKARPEKNIVVVTHGGLVHFLTGDWTESGKFAGTYNTCIYIHTMAAFFLSPLFFSKEVGPGRFSNLKYISCMNNTGTGWDNTEFRSYRFVDEEGPNEAFVETDESRQRRKGTEKPLTDAEQTKLKEVESKS